MQLAYGATDVYNALIYGEKHPGTVDFLKNQFVGATTMLTDAGRHFYETAKASFEHYNSNAALNYARNAIKALTGGNTDIQSVQYLGELKQLQNASVLMQRWLMACPEMRERYFEQKLDGYSDTYVNVSGLDIGRNHYDYRCVMHGLMTIDEDGTERWTQYFDELKEGDRELLLSEKVDIVDSWNAMNVLMQFGDDPTNPYGGKL
jgi:hypothetical protein